MLTPRERNALEKEWNAINDELERQRVDAPRLHVCESDPQPIADCPSADDLLGRLDEIEFALGEEYLAERREEGNGERL